MKIYTQEQVIEVFEKYGNMSAINARNILDLSESIQLPSDEEIEKEIKNEYPLTGHVGIDARNHLRKVGYSQGAKMVINKIQGGNNEQQ